MHQQAPGCRWIPICNTNGGITEKGNSLQEGMAEVYDCSKGTSAYAGEGRPPWAYGESTGMLPQMLASTRTGKYHKTDATKYESMAEARRAGVRTTAWGMSGGGGCRPKRRKCIGRRIDRGKGKWRRKGSFNNKSCLRTWLWRQHKSTLRSSCVTAIIHYVIIIITITTKKIIIYLMKPYT